MDPYFDDEDEENQEIYRKLLRNHEKVPPCDPLILPCSSLSQSCVLCSRLEAETILKTAPAVKPGHFIVRPSPHINYPYSLSVLFNERIIHHFQICQKSNKYSVAPVQKIDLLTTQTFPSLSTLLEYYLTNSIIFQEDKNTKNSITLKLYPCMEVTKF